MDSPISLRLKNCNQDLQATSKRQFYSYQ